jgi:hypothetical protein
MSKGKPTKSQINLLISAFLYGLGKKPFGVLRSTRVATLGPMLSQGLLQYGKDPGVFLEITVAGVEALRGLSHEGHDLPELIKQWDAETKALAVVKRLESIHMDAYKALSFQMDWPKACSITKPSSSWFFRASPRAPRLVEAVLCSIEEAKAKLPEDILKLRRQLLDLEDLLEGVNRIDKELRALNVKASDVSDDGGSDGTDD